jgi:hypothetical protein
MPVVHRGGFRFRFVSVLLHMCKHLVAVDGGDPPRSGSAIVMINVLDANDNGPSFEYSSYEVTVTENLAVGTTVAKVTAYDPDIGPNAEVRCSI